MKNLLILLACAGVLTTHQLQAQKSPIPKEKLSLDDLSFFKSPSSNWTLAEDVFFDLNSTKSKLRNGTGILVNTSSKDNQPIQTLLEHGDIELEMDFMLAEGSNSGIYLQGRYEIQLADSWGSQITNITNAGAINQRWDETRGVGREGYEGHPPIQNVSKAPGLWQHIKVAFKAPKFDEAGNKLENARFESVYLNNILVQKNIEVTGVTRNAEFTDEQPLGPLIIEGENGAIAIRNIEYKTFGQSTVTLSDMILTSFENVKGLDQLNAENAKDTMAIDVLAHLASADNNEFAGVITGSLEVPRAGEYFFTMLLNWIPDEYRADVINGAGKLEIDGKEVILNKGTGSSAQGSINLTEGQHKLKMSYYKGFNLWYARNNDLGLTMEGNGLAQTQLNAPLRDANTPGQITVKIENKAISQRGFFMFKGNKRTHTMAVGAPGGVNYVYDLDKGELLSIWRGKFVNTTPMWYGRGESQLMEAMGNLIELGGKPSFAYLSNETNSWPTENADYSYQGYSIRPNGEPIIHYTISDIPISETLEASADGRRLTHVVQLAPDYLSKEIWVYVAEGETIEKLPNGLYAIDDKSYYIELEGKETPQIRDTSDGRKEMILPLKTKGSSGVVKYSFIW